MSQLTLEDVERAQARIGPHVRRTPLLPVGRLRRPVPEVAELWLKLESLQVSGSFKARGALNRVLSLSRAEVARGVVTASGGNHGLGVAYAGWLLDVPAYVYLPHNTPPKKRRQFARWGAEVVVEGQVWDDANRAAQVRAERDGLPVVHAFADPEVVAGQGTIGLEILEAAADVDVLVVPVGGGGLISGVALAACSLRSAIRVVGVEPEGAPTLHASLAAGRLVELPRLDTAANTLAPRRSEPLNFELVRRYVEEIVLVSDAQLQEAARWLWEELGVAAELSAAAACAALRVGRVSRARGARVVALVTGAGTDGLQGA